MKQKGNIGLKVVLGIAIVVFCFLPLIPMSYEVIVEKQISEEYTAVEPYTVQEEVKEPYQSPREYVYWQESEDEVEGEDEDKDKLPYFICWQESNGQRIAWDWVRYDNPNRYPSGYKYPPGDSIVVADEAEARALIDKWRHGQA